MDIVSANRAELIPQEDGLAEVPSQSMSMQTEPHELLEEEDEDIDDIDLTVVDVSADE